MNARQVTDDSIVVVYNEAGGIVMSRYAGFLYERIDQVYLNSNQTAHPVVLCGEKRRELLVGCEIARRQKRQDHIPALAHGNRRSVLGGYRLPWLHPCDVVVCMRYEVILYQDYSRSE